MIASTGTRRASVAVVRIGRCHAGRRAGNRGTSRIPSKPRRVGPLREAAAPRLQRRIEQDIFDVPGSAPADAAAVAEVAEATPRLDFEKLDVYHVAMEFHALAASLRLPAGRGELRDQLARAALSIVLNTAEGGGRTGAADKARFYAMARGSAMECAALFDILGSLRLVPRPVCSRARGLLLRIVQMHTRLCLRQKS